jgi:nitric oxide reductase activation protein
MPGCVVVAATSSDRIIGECGTAGFEAFVTVGLRAVAGDPARHLAFFRLEDAEARRVLDRLSGQVTFSTLQGRLRAFSVALWGSSYPLREAGPPPEGTLPSRTQVSSGIVRLPDVFKSVSNAMAPKLYEAAVAHATAHLALGSPRFEPGHLKQLQIVLVGLVEDARIEALAMRRFPGLFHLWSQFHTAEPSPLKTVPAILARLARALLESSYEDNDGIVSKARALFNAEPDLGDPDLSRRIGGLIGNDIGQMRIQFNAKLHVIEPLYRDDNLGLWRLPPPPPDAAVEQLKLAVESVRLERDSDQDHGHQPDEVDLEPSAGRARSVAPDDHGIAVAHYPEWDRAAALERSDWTTIREVEALFGATHVLEEAIASNVGLRLRIERLVRSARVGRPTRLRRQLDGIDLDLDAAIDAATALRAGEIPEARIHLREVLRSRDLAVLVLIDISESTKDRVQAADASIIEIEKVAVGVLAQAMEALGDRFALEAFSSNGRHEVRFTVVKAFSQPFDHDAKARLAGLQPHLSTRLGAALRHAGAELRPISATRRIVIALTDGAPSDIDVPDPADLIEDARRAVLLLRQDGIDVFGITLDPAGQGAGGTVFGRANHMPVRRIEDLPRRLSELYFRISRR